MTDTIPAANADDITFGSSVKPGLYEARLVDYSTFVGTYEGEERTLLRIAFQVAIPDGVEEIDGVTSLSTGPKSKLRAWVTSLIGRPPEGGEKLGSLGLKGRRCMVNIAINEAGYPKIESVLPAIAQPAAQA